VATSEGVARRLAIHGVVQGVFYRESMRREAARLGIAGWVRNLADGSVEAHVEGSLEAVELITAWAGRGPEHARVTRVDCRPAQPEGLAGFERRPGS
jgi:acylphosphatase